MLVLNMGGNVIAGTLSTQGLWWLLEAMLTATWSALATIWSSVELAIDSRFIN
jgi:hypothetical protein